MTNWLLVYQAKKAKGAEQAMQDVERLLASDNHRLAPAAAQWLSAIVEGRPVPIAKGDVEEPTGKDKG